MLIRDLLLFFYLYPLTDEKGEVILSTEKLLAGFANPALITVLCLLVLGQAIIQTGALNEVANFILFISRNNAIIATTLSLLFVMLVSAFLNNTPVVVIFIPIMAALAKAVSRSISRVMIPLSYVSILGVMTTLIGSSTNLLVSGIMVEMDMEPLKFFDFIEPGAIMAAIGFLYVVIILPKFLPDRASMLKSYTENEEEDDRQFIAQIEIDYSSDFVGQKLENGSMAGFKEITVRMVQRGEHAFLPPFEEDFVIRPRDIIVVAAPKKDITSFFAKHPDKLEHHFASYSDDYDEDEDIITDMSIAEIVVSPSSKIVGKTLEQSNFYGGTQCVVLGIQRQSRNIRAKVTEIRLSAGDVLLVMGSKEDIINLHENKDFLLMGWSTEELHSGTKAPRAAIIFATVVGLAAFDIVPIKIMAFIGVAAVIISGCINLRQAARALDLKIVLMIAASLALGSALQVTGGASYIAHILISLLEGSPAIVIMSALFILMAVLTNVLSNNATAVLFTPIAINLAVQLQVDPRMFLFAVIFACNCSFITPIGYQTNLMVMGPGHYKFHDFIRSGIPLAIILWITYTAYAMMYYN